MAETASLGPTLLTVAELAELLNTSPRSIYRFSTEKKLPAPLRLGQQPRWRRSEILAWIDAGMPPAEEWEKSRA